MFCYKDNGISFFACDGNYVPQAGEFLFSTYATPEQLSAAFPNYTTTLASINKEVANAPILAQIAALEAKQARSVREVLCGMTTSQAYLNSLNSQITILRGTLQ